jgi:hypothetical protein
VVRTRSTNFNSRDLPHHVDCDTRVTVCDNCHMLFLTHSPLCLRHFALIARRVRLPTASLRFLAVMPPRTKRKTTEESLPSKKRVKKTDTIGSQVSVASTAGSDAVSSSQPTNTQVPDEISFPERVPGTKRISAWNVCSWASSNKKVGFRQQFRVRGDSQIDGVQGFGRYVEAEDADILVLTETKVCALRRLPSSQLTRCLGERRAYGSNNCEAVSVQILVDFNEEGILYGQFFALLVCILTGNSRHGHIFET